MLCGGLALCASAWLAGVFDCVEVHVLFAVPDGRVGVLVVFAQPVDALVWELRPFDIVATSGDGLSALRHAFGVVFLFAGFAPRGTTAGGLLAAVEVG